MLVLAVALSAGLLAGYALGGRILHVEHLRLTAPWLVVSAMAVQLVIFSPLGRPLGETASIALHLASYACLIVFALLNLRSVGIAVAGAGTALNTLVIAVNGGYMPASERALEIAGLAAEAEPHNNSAVADAGARLLPLGDVFAVPDRVPLLANVFSVGDILIAAGVALLLAAAMRAPRDAQAAPERLPPGEAGPA